ncbi:ScbA/BarX family gamma-butyrolactone biosynthesis protein [Actinokineospora sp.]|uniref:ScbA/BarX family gamma-butyrolactone biosynthesis protein n=1 Tax=Actinokineospora sp. TaxID=1872133 RepID=UPI00403790CB
MTTTLDQLSEGPSGDLSGPRLVRFDQTMPRHLVHRAAVSEVFVTDLQAAVDNVDNVARVGVQWPRRHGFFRPRTADAHDPLLFAESIRQAGLALAHQEFGVPMTDTFLYQRKTLTIDPAGLRTAGKPVNLIITATAPDGPAWGSATRGNVRFEFECYRDGRQIGSASTVWRRVSPAVYRKVRGSRVSATPHDAPQLPPVEPALVGRDRCEDVVIAETGPGVWALRFDPDHPVLFDHPVDHVPGMLLLEAARQAAVRMVGHPHALPVGLDFRFARYIEFDAPCLITARTGAPTVTGDRTMTLAFEQAGRLMGSASLAMHIT